MIKSEGTYRVIQTRSGLLCSSEGRQGAQTAATGLLRGSAAGELKSTATGPVFLLRCTLVSGSRLLPLQLPPVPVSPGVSLRWWNKAAATRRGFRAQFKGPKQ